MKHTTLAMTLLVLAATLAGCSAREPPPPSSPDLAPSDPAPIEEVPAPRRFWNSTETLQVPAAGESVTIPLQNCVAAISETAQVISNVTATATWSSVAPTNFYIIYEEGPDRRQAHNVSSSSPLSIQMLEGAHITPRTSTLFWISVEPASGNVAPLTEIQLTLSFEHDDELEIWPGGCDLAGPF